MKVVLYGVAALIIVHGLVHLMEFVAYWPLATVPDLPYKTALIALDWAAAFRGAILNAVILAGLLMAQMLIR